MRNRLLVLLFVFMFNSVRSSACTGMPGSVDRVVCLADSLKSTMTATQQSSLQLSYSYVNSQSWSNLPTTMQPRLGLSLASMTAAQVPIAMMIVREISGTAIDEGYDEAQQLLIADEYLKNNGGGSGYGQGLYYLCFNGTPTLTGLFSIKFGGHHLQIENTYNNGVMVGATPHFEAIEPVTFTTGGVTYDPITQEKNALSAMFSTLSTTELATAHLSTTFTDVLMGAKNNGSYKDWIFPATKVGLCAGGLTTAQKNLVLDAIRTYVYDIDSINCDAIMGMYSLQINDTYIAYSGTTSLATRNDYVRIDGPGVWIEFTVQGGIIFSGVHYHSIWRDHFRDYGGAGSAAGIQSTPVGSVMTGMDELQQEKQVCTVRQNYPNPMSGRTTFPISLDQDGHLSIVIVDQQGRVVSHLMTDRPFVAGNHEIPFISEDGTMAAGIYYVDLSFRNSRMTSRTRKPFIVQ